MKSITLFFAILLCSMSFHCLAQDPVIIAEEGARGDLDVEPDVSELTFRQRLHVGGGISGLSFGNPTSIGLSPMVGYMATNTTIVGVGATYQYFAYRGSQASNLFGQRLFVRQYVPALSQLLGQSFLTAQVENFSDMSNSYAPYSNPVLVGIGIGSKIGINLNIMYDLNYSASKTSPYGSALVVQVGGFFF
ncbi:MAG: hypothetical protein ACKOXC_05955 [Aquirufa sp.]